MLWLPLPSDKGNHPPIAVADAAAAAIERALLEQDASAAANRLATAMVFDPWFCRWLRYWSPNEHQCIDDLAAWFAPQIAPLLSPAAEQGDAWTRTSEQDANRFAAQAALALQRALEATESGEDLAASPAYFAALLSVNEVEADSDSDSPSDGYLAVCEGIEWRLPRLFALLAALAKPDLDFDRRLEQAKLDAMKELAYGASHEINNPLANISGRVQALLREESDPQRRRVLAAIDAQALRAHEMISDLMLFARPPALEKELTDLRVVIATAVEELRPLAESRKITVDFERPETEWTAEVDPTQMIVVVQAVVRNAIEAIGHDGRVRVTLGRIKDVVTISVCDTGPGIPDGVRPHLFDPFYSGREAGRGLGFGLSKCWRIVTDHGGSIDVASSSHGATFTLHLPAIVHDGEDSA